MKYCVVAGEYTYMTDNFITAVKYAFSQNGIVDNIVIIDSDSLKRYPVRNGRLIMTEN